MKKLFPPIFLFFLLSLPALPAPAKSPPPPDEFVAPAPAQSTPDLIEAAFRRGKIEEEAAALYLAYAFFAPEKLPPAFRSKIPWRGTMPWLTLQDRLAAMPAGPTRAAIEALLAEADTRRRRSPTAGIDTPHFHIEYSLIEGGLVITDYVEALETAWDTQVNLFGWAGPPIVHGSGHYPVYIQTLTHYGYVAAASTVGDNPNTPWNEGDAQASYMVLNQDYSTLPGTPRAALDATVAHELNHSLQYGYGALAGSNRPDSVFVEGGATWIEDEVFDASNDNYHYLWPDFTTCMGAYPLYPYSYWVIFRGLTESFGTTTPAGGEQVMQDFWETMSQAGGNVQLTALAQGLTNAGALSLGDAYYQMAIALKFNKPCGGSYAGPYCMEEGPAYTAYAGEPPSQGAILQVGDEAGGQVQDHYALNWVDLPLNTPPYSITLQNQSTGGELRAGVVCDTGPALAVTPLPQIARGEMSVTLPEFNPAGCQKVVMVITNQAQTAANPAGCAAATYRLRVSGPTRRIFLPVVWSAGSD